MTLERNRCRMEVGAHSGLSTFQRSPAPPHAKCKRHALRPE